MCISYMRLRNAGWIGALALILMMTGCAPMKEGQKSARQEQVVFPAPPDPPRFIYERTFYGSANVIPESSDGALKRLVTGETERSEGLAKPYAVAVHRGRIFVSDSVERFIKVFDVPEGRYFIIGDDEQGMLAKPLGLDVDMAGNLYVADASHRAIMVYNRDGKYQRKIGGPKLFERLSSVTVDAVRQRLLVVDIGGVASEQHKVRVFDIVSGNHLYDIGKRGTGQGEFNLPRDAAIGRNGQIYVVDGGNFRIQVFDRDGKYLHSFGTVGKQLGNFARPKEIAADAEGNVYVVDAAFGNFQIFNAEGDLLMYVGERSEKDGIARYMLPSGIYVDEDGRIYMVDQWFRKVDVYRPHHLSSNDGFLGIKPKPRSTR